MKRQTPKRLGKTLLEQPSFLTKHLDVQGCNIKYALYTDMNMVQYDTTKYAYANIGYRSPKTERMRFYW